MIRGESIEVGENEILYGEYLDHVGTKMPNEHYLYHEVFG